jgi:hypothetical protein
MDTKPSKPSPLNELAFLKAENARLIEQLKKLQEERDVLHIIFTRISGLLNDSTPYLCWPLGKLQLLILSIDDVIRPLD